MATKISVAQFRKRLVDLCVRSRLEVLPKKEEDRHILLKSIVLTLNPKKEYVEQEINAVVMGWLRSVAWTMRVDHFSIRRELVDRGYLERDRRGARYQVCAEAMGKMFDSEVDELDVRDVIREGEADVRARKQAYLDNEGKIG